MHSGSKMMHMLLTVFLTYLHSCKSTWKSVAYFGTISVKRKQVLIYLSICPNS